MRGWYRCVHACGDRLPKGLVWDRVQLTVHNVLFCVQVWSLTKFYRLNGSQIANLTLDSQLTPVLCHHWQVGDVGCGHGVWTPVMKIHGDKVWKKKFICFLQSICLNLKYFENPFLTRLPQRNALLGAGEAVQIHVIHLKGVVELETLIIMIIIISNGNRTEWSTI